MNHASHRAGWTLLAVCLAAAALPLSFTGGIIAIPAIATQVGGSPLALNWVSNAFMLAFGSLLLAMGTLADRYGRKRLFCGGSLLFAAASLALGFAPNIVVLDLIRAVQGTAGAAVMAGGAAALADAFDDARRPRAFSLLGTSFGVGLSCGPVLAGWLVAHGGWRSVFLLAVAMTAVAAALGQKYLRESRSGQRAPLDVAGLVLFSLSLALFTWGILQVADSGWRDPLVIALLTAGAAGAVGFVAVELKSPQPILDLSLFRYARFLGVQLLPVATCYCFVVLLALLPARFMGVDGYGGVTTGLLMVALSGPMLVVPAFAVSLTRWFSPAGLCCFGLSAAAAGLWLLSVSDGIAAVLMCMLLIGAGTGLPWGLMDGLSVSVVPRDRAGMATGIFSTVRVAGEGVALAMVSTWLVSLLARQHGLEAVPHRAIQYLAGGNTELAQRELALPPEMVRQLYLQAFNHLMAALAVITLVCAALVYGCLRRRQESVGSGLAPDEEA